MAARRREQRAQGRRTSAATRARPADPAVPVSAPRRLAPIALALAALTVGVYAGVWSFDFVQFDDPEYVFRNPNIAGGLTWAGVHWAFTTGYAANWHPLTWLSHMFDIQMFGLAGGPPHLVNLLLHTTSVVLLFWFLARVTGARGRSAIVAALFAIHPLHVESVAWVSERKDVLSTVFWMLTLCAYAAYARTPNWRRYLTVMACFTLGLLAKPMLVTLPCVLLLLDWWPLGRLSGEAASSWSRRAWVLVREKLPLFAIAAASSVATVVAQRSGGLITSLEAIPIGLRVETAIVSYAAYLTKMVWPARLYMYYPHAISIPGWQLATGAALMIGVTAIVILARRQRPYLAVGWLWYLGTLVPVIGLVQVGRQALADRYTYIPLIGAFILIVWGAADLIARWPARRWVAPIVAVLVIAPYAVVARAQVQSWRNDSTLWTHALRTSIGLDERRTSLAVEYLLAENNLVPMQTLLFAQEGAGSVFPPMARQYLGRLFARHNQLDEAVRSFEEAIELAPKVADFHTDLAGVLSRQGKADASVAEYETALRLNPDLAQAHHELGLLLAGQGKVEEALPHFAEAVRLRPDNPDAHRNLAVTLARMGRVNEAIKELQEVLRLRPDDAGVRQALAEYTKRKPPR